MKNIILLFKKDIKLFFKNTGAVIITFIVPMVLIFIFGMVFSGFGKASPMSSVKLVALDLDNTAFSQKFISYLDSLKEIKIITKYKTDTQIKNYNRKKLEDDITKGKRKIGLIIPKGFEKKILNGDKPTIKIVYDPKYNIEYGIVLGLSQKILMSKFPMLMYNSMMKKSKNFLGNQYGKMFQTDLNNVIQKYFGAKSTDEKSSVTLNNSFFDEEPIKVKTEKLVGEDIKNPMFVQSVAGMAVMFLLFSLSRAGSSILTEKNSGTLNRLLISPINSVQIIFSKLFFSSFLGIFQLSIMFIFGWLIFGLEIFSHIPALILMIVVTALAASALGMFIAAISKNESQVGGLTTLIALGMSALGGSMFPTIIMPEYMQKIGKFTLNYWAMDGFTNIFWRNLSIKNILPDVYVLFAVFLALSIISIIIFEKRIFEK